jgi:hypothetical protein
MSDVREGNLFIVVSIVVCLIMIIFYRQENFVTHRIGENYYKVYDEFNNSYEAAEILDKLNNDMIKLIKHLENKYLNDPSFDDQNLIRGIKQIRDMYKPKDTIQENVPKDSSDDTAYTINKGTIIALCLRYLNDKNKFHDLNTLRFVILHEMSHIFSVTYGHDITFWTHFKFLLQEAIIIGIYDPVNYKLTPIDYCGVSVKYNPLYDSSL